MEDSGRYDLSNIVVHRASYAKHLRSEKHLENIRQDDLVIPEWLFKEEEEPVKNKITKVYNPKTLKQIARGKIKINDKK